MLKCSYIIQNDVIKNILNHIFIWSLAMEYPNNILDKYNYNINWKELKSRKSITNVHIVIRYYIIRKIEIIINRYLFLCRFEVVRRLKICAQNK